MDTVFRINNRTLNTIANFMIKDGYAIIAKLDIIPIVIATAEKKEAIAEISDPKLISHVKHFQQKMLAA